MSNRHQPPGRVRIIGGRWRRRYLPVPDGTGLRPSADRVRETLFNWLDPYLPAARCLDLFAGTGALGFEAVSRGAASATLVEQNPGVADGLRAQAAVLDADLFTIVNAEACGWLARTPPVPFDIVFLDPPFSSGLLEAALDALTRGWLKPHAQVYLEADRIPSSDLAQNGWRIHRQSGTRHVEFALVRPGPDAGGAP